MHSTNDRMRRDPRPELRKVPPPRPQQQGRPARHRHPWVTIMVLSVGLMVALYGLVRFGYGPKPGHQANANPASADTSLKKHPKSKPPSNLIPTFPLKSSYVGMAINPPFKTTLPPVVNVLGKNPGIVETYLAFGGSIPLDQIEYLDRQQILPLIQINPKKQSLHDVAAGKYDTYLINLATQVKRIHAPVALSFAHEMNGWWYPWSVRVPNAQQVTNRPQFFVAAWRHIWKLFRAQHVTNVTWVWTCSRDAQRSGWPSLSAWWPGDRYVDWVGMNGYYRAPGQTFDYLYKEQLQIVRSFTQHPVLITETGVGHGPSQPAQISNLFSGIHRTKGMLGFIWFDLPADENWNINGDQRAIDAFHTGIAHYGD